MQHHGNHWLAVLGTAWLLACSAPDGAEHTQHEEAPFSTAPFEPNHEDITRSALDFLRPEIVAALAAANVLTDVEFHFENAHHFDDCNFTGGSRVVAASQAEAVSHLGPSATLAEADAQAWRAFGRSLHAVQDFYAHTNWVELGGTSLVDASLGSFPSLEPYSVVPSSGFVVIQGKKPKNAALSRRTDAPYPKNAVVTLRERGAPSPGLISGTVDYEPGDFCPASVAMTHDELNKDRSDLTDREAQHEAAKALATMQTRHEWCRLDQLAFEAWGEAGRARLGSWISDGAAAPDCTAE